MPANFKTYEAQARLLAAVIAAHPDLKLNYKSISDHYGKSQSTSAIEHRFRPLRTAAQVLRGLVMKGLDPDILEDIFDKKAIAEHFGESTADGIQFQFRAVKANAEALKATVAEGGDPAKALPAGKSAAAPAPAKATPRKRKTASTASTPSGSMIQSAQVGTESTTKPVRRSAAKNVRYKEESSTSNDDQDYDALDSDSPTKFVKKVKTTPLKNPVPAPAPISRGGQCDTVVIDSTSPSESSVQTPGAPGNDEVTFLKQEVVNTNPAVNSYPTFTHQPSQSSSQGNSFHVSNPGSFSQQPQPQSIFGGPSHTAPQYQQHVALGNPVQHVQDPRSAKIAEAAANLRHAFGGRAVDWTMSNQDIFNSTYYDDNGDI